MHSYREGEGLRDALSRLDAEGWNVVNFDEFVFLPIERDYQPEMWGRQPISYYYFFQPSSPRLMRAWKRNGGFSSAAFGGHLLAGSNLRPPDLNEFAMTPIRRSSAVLCRER